MARAIAAFESNDKEMIGNTLLAGTLMISETDSRFQKAGAVSAGSQVNPGLEHTLAEAEQSILGATQSAVGAYLVGCGGLPALSSRQSASRTVLRSTPEIYSPEHCRLCRQCPILQVPAGRD